MPSRIKDITPHSRTGIVALIAAIIFAGLATYAVFSVQADAAPVRDGDGDEKPEKRDKRDRDPDDLHNALIPIVHTESGVIGPGECLVTVQNALEGPVLGQEERFEPRRNEQGQLIDENGEVIPVNPDTGEPLDPGRVVHDSIGFFDVLREIEIIKVTHACGFDEGGRTVVGSGTEVELIKCTKAPDLDHARCESSNPGVPPVHVPPPGGPPPDGEPRGLDHFRCYRAFGEPEIQDPAVHLRDRFFPDGLEAVVGPPVWFCNPVSKAVIDPDTGLEQPATGIVDHSAHLLFYPLADPGGSGERPGGPVDTRVVVHNQFGEQQVVDVLALITLAVPTQKFLVNPDPGNPDTGIETGHGFPAGLNHFTCYSLNPVEPAAINLEVVLADQFFEQRAFVSQARFLCRSAIKTHAGQELRPPMPGALLVCYLLASDGFNPLEVVTGNQFGGGEFRIEQTRPLCVPSEVEVVGPTPPTPTPPPPTPTPAPATPTPAPATPTPTPVIPTPPPPTPTPTPTPATAP